jgi:uncharacterized membrane protein
MFYRQWRGVAQWGGSRLRAATGECLMSDTTVGVRHEMPDGAFWAGFRRRLLFGFVLTLVILAAWVFTMPEPSRSNLLQYWMSVRVPAPHFDPSPILRAPLSVQVHVAGAMIALVVGMVIFLLPKGTGFHRLLGWTWVSAMIVVAATSVAMMVDFGNGVNPLHVFTAITVISLWSGLAGIRRGDVRRHAASMTGLYAGGLILAGVFAFIPGRLMWDAVFGG